MAEYPEHKKLLAIKDESQAIGELLEMGLPSMGIHLCEVHKGLTTDRWFPTHRSIQSILAEWFGIDQNKIEAEKRQMLDELRTMNASQPAKSEVDPERSR